MRFVVVTTHLIKPHDNGAHVACWAVIRHLVDQGHQVISCPLIPKDQSLNGTDSDSHSTVAGPEIAPVVYSNDLSRLASGRATVFGKMRYLWGLAALEVYIPELRLRQSVAEHLQRLKPNAVILYDYAAIAAACAFHGAPKLGIVVDLWHLPVLLRWRVKDKAELGFARLKEALLVRRLARIYEQNMVPLLNSCQGKVEFAAHHAAWLRKRGVENIEYLPTPVADPFAHGSSTPPYDRRNGEKHKPRILLIGDLTGIATRMGLELFADSVLPVLEQRFGQEDFEVRIVGGGHLPDHISAKLRRPAVSFVGKVTPPDQEFLNCDVVLVPTPVEIGMRVRIAVAFSYGCCVVAHRANAAGIPEMTSGLNCLIGGSGDEMANLICLAVGDETLRRGLCESARKAYERFFLAPVAAQRVEQKLLALLREHEVAGRHAMQRPVIKPKLCLR